MTYSYTYDNRGNILSVVREAQNTNVKTTTSYTYDGLNQLTQENNQAAGKTWVYTYDAGGNIMSMENRVVSVVLMYFGHHKGVCP